MGPRTYRNFAAASWGMSLCLRWADRQGQYAFQHILVANQFIIAAMLQGMPTTSVTQLMRAKPMPIFIPQSFGDLFSISCGIVAVAFCMIIDQLRPHKQTSIIFIASSEAHYPRLNEQDSSSKSPHVLNRRNLREQVCLILTTTQLAGSAP